ncbi:MAG: radical SAM protein [Piscirickettsiaceae bacterium]|nr:MAG: radical SAM protein [Piscirickettsiaceae bacterium]PCI71030.1 MAG: radical SAM protein [Piscirickettsiaceae bacterium]
MMEYTYPLYRPPSEANSLIFQVTEGCSFNRCSFCSMYRDKSFSEKPSDLVLKEIHHAAQRHPNTRRIFLADGDALYRDCASLQIILDALYKSFPLLNRVSSYALPNNLIAKSAHELAQLKASGLQLIYYGIETGSPALLKCITKGATPHKIIEGIQKASAAGINVSATVILGLGGRQYWQEHIEGTAELVNQLQLNYLSTLQLTLDEKIKDEYRQKFSRQGRQFEPQGDSGMLEEQRLLVSLIEPKSPVIFRSNHASNALPLKGVLPKDRATIISQLDRAHGDESQLVPSWLSGL